MFKRDLALIQHAIRPHSIKDLADIIGLAQDVKRRRKLASQIEKAAEESQAKNWVETQQ